MLDHANHLNTSDVAVGTGQGGHALEKTLFEKYGGFSVVSKIVLDFYDRLLDDDDVGPFFDHIEMARIVDHQTKFISALMGGPASYTDDQIHKMHERMTITHAQFDTMQRILRETLADNDLAPEDVETIASAFEARRGLVVE